MIYTDPAPARPYCDECRARLVIPEELPDNADKDVINPEASAPPTWQNAHYHYCLECCLYFFSSSPTYRAHKYRVWRERRLAFETARIAEMKKDFAAIRARTKGAPINAI